VAKAGSVPRCSSVPSSRDRGSPSPASPRAERRAGEPAGIEAPSDLQRQIEGPQPLEERAARWTGRPRPKARRASSRGPHRKAEQVEEIVVRPPPGGAPRGHSRRGFGAQRRAPQAANVTRLDEIGNGSRTSHLPDLDGPDGVSRPPRLGAPRSSTSIKGGITSAVFCRGTTARCSTSSTPSRSRCCAARGTLFGRTRSAARSSSRPCSRRRTSRPRLDAGGSFHLRSRAMLNVPISSDTSRTSSSRA
jgi:hypothetical protein